MILGLDASTTCCGWAFSNSGSVCDAGFIDISKFKTNKEKSLCIIKTLLENCCITKTSQINLESSLSGFSPGFTSQQVIILLSKFNAILEYVLYEKLYIPVNLINVNTARKKILGKCRIKGMNSKLFVLAELSKKMNISVWDKKTSRNNWDKRNYDIYDAILMSLYEK